MGDGAASDAFAWSSPPRALLFAKALAEVVIRHRPFDVIDEDEQSDDTERLRAVLQVILDFTPVEAASLWKLKARANHASCIAHTTPGAVPSGAGFCAPGQSFVCDLSAPVISEVLRRYADECARLTDSGDPTTVVALENRLYIPFGRLCGPEADSGGSPNYLIELFCSEPDEAEPCWGIPLDVFEAMKSKLTSGICALVDRRLTRITREMSNVTVSDANAGADYAIDKSIQKVIPRFIRCQRVIRLDQEMGGDYRVAQDKLLRTGLSEDVETPPLPLDEQAVGELVGLIEAAYQREHNPRGTDTVLIFEPVEKGDLTDPAFAGIRNLMVASLHDKGESSGQLGYLVLINRLNDLSAALHLESLVPDYFDWEDELYVSHIGLIVGFIKELFVAEETRLRRAHILSHEMHAPTGFIYSTVERILDSVEGHRPMPDAMIRRELNDILLTNELQTALIDSLMLGLQVGNLPPRKKYVPERISLREVADNITRMVIPICRKFQVPHSGISMRNLPDLVIDRRAITQVFLNLTTNAIKYAGNKMDFKLQVFSEDLRLEELAVTEAPSALRQRLEELGVKRGRLIIFRDFGIGVPRGFRERMFQPGIRASNPEVLSKSGAGLGLSVVRTIMRDHLGEVWLERRNGPTELALFFPDIVETGEYRRTESWRGGA